MRAAAVLLVAVTLAAKPATAETIKIGVLRGVQSGGPTYIAQERGYFAAEGLTVEILPFDAAQPIAVAVASGDIDFGSEGLTGGLYSLAGQGLLHIIAGVNREAPGFNGLWYLAANRAYDTGLTTLASMPGHSVAVTQIGSANHYSLGLLAEKYHFDLAAVRLLALQSNSNIASAIAGGQSDAALLAGSLAFPLVQRGEARLLGRVGEETPWQLGAVWTATKTANERGELVQRFLRAFRQGTRDYHDAFTGPDETRHDSDDAPAILAILGKYLGDPAATLRLNINYIDRDARLDARDVARQIAWYRAQNMVKGALDAEAVIDRRYALLLPER